MSEEHVLVVPTSVVEAIGPFSGFQPDVERYLQPLLESDQLSFQPRSSMESDPSFKQLIPYVLFEWLDPDNQPHLFQYTRGTGQGEARLHARRSVGVGGHISRDDADSADPYQTGMRRELDEEVRIETSTEDSIVGLIYDPSTDVGQVHLGIVHRCRVVHPRVFPNEPDLVDAMFQPVADLLAQKDDFEVWSQLCLEHLFETSDVRL